MSLQKVKALINIIEGTGKRRAGSVFEMDRKKAELHRQRGFVVFVEDAPAPVVEPAAKVDRAAEKAAAEAEKKAAADKAQAEADAKAAEEAAAKEAAEKAAAEEAAAALLLAQGSDKKADADTGKPARNGSK